MSFGRVFSLCILYVGPADFVPSVSAVPSVPAALSVNLTKLESAEMLRKSGQELTPSLWLIKLLMGAIDSSYDERDEK